VSDAPASGETRTQTGCTLPLLLKVVKAFPMRNGQMDQFAFRECPLYLEGQLACAFKEAVPSEFRNAF